MNQNLRKMCRGTGGQARGKGTILRWDWGMKTSTTRALAPCPMEKGSCSTLVSLPLPSSSGPAQYQAVREVRADGPEGTPSTFTSPDVSKPARLPPTGSWGLWRLPSHLPPSSPSPGSDPSAACRSLVPNLLWF